MSAVDLRIGEIAGNCPVQATGFVNGKPFYFRARWQGWSFTVGEPDEWDYFEEWGDGPYAAGWMPHEVAREMIGKAAKLYTSGYPSAS